MPKPWEQHPKSWPDGTSHPSFRESWNINEFGKHEATKRVEELTHVEKYVGVQSGYMASNAAHRRTDIDIPQNVDTSENSIMDDENF